MIWIKTLKKRKNIKYFKLIILSFLIFFFVCLLLTNVNLDKSNKVKILFLIGILVFTVFIFICNKISKNIKLLIGSIIFFLILLEVILEIYPLILGDDFANIVLLKYHAGCDGIYEYDPILNIHFMKPNFKTIVYYDRYRWVHETDSFGFRNPLDRNNVSLVLLGDSYIYGHGVNQNQTVGYFIEQFTNYSVTNLARQGDCSYQQMYLLNKYGLKFKPKYLFYFFNSGDANIDSYAVLTENHMKEFIATPIEDITFKERGDKENKKKNKFIEYYNCFLDKPPYLFKAYQFIKLNIFKKILKKDQTSILTEDQINNLMWSDDNTLGWNYTKKAILQMKYISDLNEIDFIIVPLTHRYTNQFEILKNFALQHNISFIDTQIINNINSYYLPHDGHFSEEGARATAELIAKYLNKII